MLKFGCATRDITPDRPVWMGGYANRDGPSTGVSEPILAGCIAVQAGEGQAGEGQADGAVPALIVTLDLVGVHDAAARALAARIAERTGVPVERIMLACSHTHYAPAAGLQRIRRPHVGWNGINDADAAYVDEMTTKVVSACAEAVSRLAPGMVEVLRTRVPQVHYNRRIRQPDGSVATTFRYPDGTGPAPELSPTDDRLTALRFRAADSGDVGAILVHFGCHTVTGDRHGDSTSLLVSSDFVHYLRGALADEYGCPVFFAQAAAGDVVPMRRLGESRRWIGETLAHAVLLGDRAFRPVAADRVDVTWDELRARVRHDLTGDPEARLQAAADRLRAAPGGQDEAVRGAYLEALHLAYAARRWPEGSFAVRIQQVRIGDLPLVALPFEVLAELGLRVAERFPDALVISYANGYEGYLPFRHDLAAGGYEAQTGSAHFEPGTAERILDAVLRGLERPP